MHNNFLFLQGWIGFTLLSEMPSYLTDILGFDLESAGILCVFPYAALFVSTLSFARLFDYLQREKQWQVKHVRRAAMFIAYMGSATGLVICGFLDDKYAAYTFMIITQVINNAKLLKTGTRILICPQVTCFFLFKRLYPDFIRLLYVLHTIYSLHSEQLVLV